VEASAIHAPGGIGRSPIGLPLLRLRSDDQLLALFRAGSDDAFRAIHDRYRQRLFAYVRQMLCAGPRQDAEDVLQDVFVRAYGALRADARAVNVRAWLYRVAHNRCIDHLRRPVPPAADVFELSRKPLHDPIEEAQRREDLARLVSDIGRLPEQQRSALLMREIDGMSYADLAGTLDVSVPAVKSLLVRARIGLVEAAEARDADCADIRVELMDAYDRGVKASSRARRHMKSCDACTEYRAALRGMRRSFAALSPAGAGPLALVGAKLLGLGGAGGGAAAGGSAAVGGGTAAAVGGATACKVAAVVCTAAITASGAVEVRHLAAKDPQPAPAAQAAPAPPAAAPVAQSTATLPAKSTFRPHIAPAPARSRLEKPKAKAKDKPAADKPAEDTTTQATAPSAVAPDTTEEAAPPTESAPSGGTQAPDPPAGAPAESAPSPSTGTGAGSTEAPPAATPTAPPPSDTGSGTPPTEH
jgi:RNA polymerase sigma factor (sigma-70 family)